MGRPPGGHLPGTQKFPGQFPAAGSEEEFWDRCKRASELKAQSMTYHEIGAQFDPPVSAAQARKYVKRWYRAAARFYPALETREMLFDALQQQLRLAMSKYSTLDARNAAGRHVHFPTMSDIDRIELQLKFIARSQSIIVAQAELHGLRRAAVEINLPALPERQENAISALPPIEVQQRIREHASQMRALMSPTPIDAEVSPAQTAPSQPETDDAQEAPEEPTGGETEAPAEGEDLGFRAG